MAKYGKKLAKRLAKRIIGVIDTHTYLRRDDDGHYHGEIYADYRDEFDESTIKKMFQADNPREKFYESLDFDDCDWYERVELLKTLEKHFNDTDETLDYNTHEDFIRDWVCENVFFNYPYDHFLNQDVCIDIIVDTGDGNYDYTKNELFGCSYTEKGLDDREESSLVWLMQQQGYGMDAITDFVLNENMQDSKLLKSIYQECINTTTCMNSLAFFVKLSLREALDLYEHVNNICAKESDPEKAGAEADTHLDGITLDKGTACGLYDAWNGAGSVLHIELEKDVVLPVKFIDSAMPDGCRGYSVSSIYGMLGSFWSDGGLKINEQGGMAA